MVHVPPGVTRATQRDAEVAALAIARQQQQQSTEAEYLRQDRVNLLLSEAHLRKALEESQGETRAAHKLAAINGKAAKVCLCIALIEAAGIVGLFSALLARL
jgi:hypothetical protein